ncbi:MAG: MG2 domain-containing protein, partial [Bacteroidota bacterium]
MKAEPKKLLRISLAGASVIAIMAVIIAAGNSFPVKLNPFLKNLKTKLTAYNTHLPEDRVYVHFDKPFYKPGDDIWFSAYVRDAASMEKSTRSDILHVELINPKGNVQKKIKLVAREGIAKGDFHLDEMAAGGLYKIKAYTKFQENQAEAFLFEKELQVQKVVLPNLKMKLEFERKAYGAGDKVIAKLDLQTNENQPLTNHKFKYIATLDGGKLVELDGQTDKSGKARLRVSLPDELNTTDGLVNVMIDFEGLTESISRSIPIVLNKIGIEFFPEGGDLVSGLQSKVAFRALNEFGKPADIEGVVIDDQGAEVGTLKSFHQGMGAFSFNPGEDRTYQVRLTKPEGITKTYDLPEAMPRGYVLNIADNDTKELTAMVRATENEPMSLVAQVRGETYWASEVDITRGNNEIRIPIHKFPVGVCQLTLFDQKGIERAERLAFVNRDKQLNIDIQTNKQKYLPREKVKMTL